jgi:hypothetical protein
MIPLQFQLARGIHELSFYSTDGALLLVAVNRFGRKVARIPVHHLRDYASAVADLEAILEAVDPDRLVQELVARRFVFRRAGETGATGTRAGLSLMP